MLRRTPSIQRLLVQTQTRCFALPRTTLIPAPDSFTPRDTEEPRGISWPADNPTGLNRLRPLTNGMRHTVLEDRSHLWKGRPVRELTVGLRKSGGRNNQGRTTVWGIGGGHKQRYRFVDFSRRKVLDHEGIVQRLEYDPNRSASVALVHYPTLELDNGDADEQNGTLSYIVAPHGLAPGDVVTSSTEENLDIRLGNCMPLHRMPIGIELHNIELAAGKGAQLCRSAGTCAKLIGMDTAKKGYATIRLASKELRLVRKECMAVVGKVSNPQHKLINLGKAGRNRWLGRRPSVRGTAMNPVDHPHGGGEGKQAGGRPSVTPWGRPTKGSPTRSRKKHSNDLIIGRRPLNRAKYGTQTRAWRHGPKKK